MNKNIHLNLTIVLFSSWFTGLLGMFLIQDRVSLAHEQIHKNNTLELSEFHQEKFLTTSIPWQQLSEGKFDFEPQLLQDIDNSDASFSIPKYKKKAKTVTKSDFDLPEKKAPPVKEALPKTKITTKTVIKSNPEVALTRTLALIRKFEGFRSRAYRDTDGTPVIGYGLSRVSGRRVRLGDRISTHHADRALKAEVHAIQKQIKSIVKVELNSHQLGALTSFAFNAGFYNLKRSTLLRKLNAGDHHGAANEFLRWNKAHYGGRLVPLKGLTRRRHAERQLFLTELTP